MTPTRRSARNFLEKKKALQNELGQILISVLTCEESLDKLWPMAEGLIERYRGVISAWNKLDLHNRSIQQFDSLYSAHWGNALFGRTNGDPSESSLVQNLKFSKRYSAAHLVDSRKNQLMYCIIKRLWHHPDCGGKAQGSPLKHQITKMYQRVQQSDCG